MSIFQHLKQAGFICERKGALHAYNGNLGFECCISTPADEWKTLLGQHGANFLDLS